MYPIENVYFYSAVRILHALVILGRYVRMRNRLGLLVLVRKPIVSNLSNIINIFDLLKSNIIL